MFLIQTRVENNQRGFVNIINSADDAREWTNYHQFDDIEHAKKECEILISKGQYKSDNIRILEVVCTFGSEIKVIPECTR